MHSKAVGAGFLVAVLAWVAATATPADPREPTGSLQARQRCVLCRANVRNLDTALDMYSTDNAGRYPGRLGALVPVYLEAIPTCPSAGRDTYSAAYAKDHQAQGGDRATGTLVFCQGANHTAAGFPLDYPRYASGTEVSPP